MNNNYPYMNDYQKMKTYIVKKGDSLYSIAKNHNVDLEELKNVNKLATTMIYPNQVLFLPETKYDTYITQNGDTMKVVLEYLGIKIPMHGYESLLELELASNQQISTTDGSIIYNGESLEDILFNNNISAKRFIELNKSSWLQSGSKFRVK